MRRGPQNDNFHERMVVAKREFEKRSRVIVESELPEGWVFEYTRSNLTGTCYYLEKRIEGPAPKTRKSLYICLHEIGHSRLHYREKNVWKTVSRPIYQTEYEAEQFAVEAMGRHGMKVHRDSIERAKGYVREKLRTAMRHGLKSFDHEIAEWCGFV